MLVYDVAIASRVKTLQTSEYQLDFRSVYVTSSVAFITEPITRICRDAEKGHSRVRRRAYVGAEGHARRLELVRQCHIIAKQAIPARTNTDMKTTSVISACEKSTNCSTI